MTGRTRATDWERLSQNDILSPDDVLAIAKSLQRMDARSPTGEWTQQTLTLIQRHPGVVSTELAAKIGMERFAFKANVRKLKRLGLTHSLEVGYRLSPRGLAFMRAYYQSRGDLMRDPAQYARFGDERARPFWDLLSRIPPKPFREAVDLGCGTGELTTGIAERWPAAHVLGLDSSPRMLAGASAFAQPGKLDFAEADIADYDQPVDLLLSNAALHWLADHATLIPRLAALVQPGGTMAVQMPSNFDQPSHLLMEDTARGGPWSDKLAAWQPLMVEPLSWYVNLLLGLGFSVDAWETIYYLQLQGADPVLEWVKGTSLQPVLALLGEPEQQAFSQAYAQRLRAAYPPTTAGTLFPFKRIFFVANRERGL